MADFDFNTAEEEELQYKTFWERLRDSFGKFYFICPFFLEHTELEVRRTVVEKYRGGVL